MVLNFKDGTRMAVPNGPSATDFLQHDLHWLVYVHGKVTKFDSENKSSAFAVQLPKSYQAENCLFC